MTDESPYIEQRNGRAMIVGHRLSVVDIIRTLRVSGYSTQATADYFRIDPEIVEACRVYEARHQEQIDEEIDSTVLENEPVTKDDLKNYRESSAATKHRVAVNVARTMLSDPDFRNWVEAEMARMLKEQSYGDRILEQARAMFEIGEDPGRIWCWINGLKTYGEGETWGEAYHDTLDEIGYALQELWDAREASREPELSGGDATEAQAIRPEGMDANYAIGALRDFAKAKANLGERTFALSELQRYLSGGRS